MTSAQEDLEGYVNAPEPGATELSVGELQEAFRRRQGEIEARLTSFQTLGREGSPLELLHELAFCLCTPQTSAEACDRAVRALQAQDLLEAGSPEEIAGVLNESGVRFHVTKAGWIAQARDRFLRATPSIRDLLEAQGEDPHGLREWLQQEVAGLGFKEASHFLRNVGFGGDFAILDRHILTNLLRLGVIETIPKSLSRTRYLEVESQVRTFSQTSGIPMAQLDLLWWALETGYVFK